MIVDTGGLLNIVRNVIWAGWRDMFKLTKQEQMIAAFLAAILLLGVAAKEWRARHPRTPAAAAAETETK